MKNLYRMSECEEQVMIVIWAFKEEQSLCEIVREVNLRFQKEWRPQTVSTFLKRLAEKEYLTTEKRGWYTYYYPTVTLEDYRNERISELVMLLYKNNRQQAYQDLLLCTGVTN